MTKERIRRVHAIAQGRKGLDDERYRMILESIGVTSCKQMKRRHYRDFMERMRKLPDDPAWRERRAHDSNTG